MMMASALEEWEAWEPWEEWEASQVSGALAAECMTSSVVDSEASAVVEMEDSLKCSFHQVWALPQAQLLLNLKLSSRTESA
jgi:hypothetical protein